MGQLSFVFISAFLQFGNALQANATLGREGAFDDKGFFEDVMENPGEYSYILIIFLVMGYLLWRGQRLGEDD